MHDPLKAKDYPTGVPARAPLQIQNPSDPRNKRWALPPVVDPRAVEQLIAETGLARGVARLLVQRGFATREAATLFLAPKLSHLHDPFALKGVRELVDRLVAMRTAGTPIAVHGDYDVDGICSTTLLTVVLRKLGFTVTPFVPDRMVDGYGLSVRALELFRAAGIRTVLTCDVGISAVEEVRQAKAWGFDVFVTDHHHAPAVLPDADVIVNPQQPGCTYPNKALCGAGVAFKVLQGLVRTLGLDERSVLFPHLDLVGLATVADVVALTGENRVLVRNAVRLFREAPKLGLVGQLNLGLRALLEVAKVPLANVSEQTFGFVLGPRLNAVGRIDKAEEGLKLLLADTPEVATPLAGFINDVNARRQAMTKAIEESAHKMIEAMDLDAVYGLVLYSPRPGEAAGAAPSAPAEDVPEGGAAAAGESAVVEWHHGVIGIVAGRLVERYGRPCFLFAFDEKSQAWKGSGRAPTKQGNVHLFDALEQCKPHLHRFGGHAAAAGATLAATTPAEREAFRAAFDQAMRTQMRPDERTPLLLADLEVSLADLTMDFYELLQRFSPFGHGNESIRLIARNVQVTAARAIGGDKTHLKLTLAQPGASALDGIAFSFAARFPETLVTPTPYAVDLLFSLDKNEYRGAISLQARVDDLVLSASAMAPVATAGHAASARTAGAAGAGADAGRVAPATVGGIAKRVTPAEARAALKARATPGTAPTAVPASVPPAPQTTPAPAAALETAALTALDDVTDGLLDMFQGARQARPAPLVNAVTVTPAASTPGPVASVPPRTSAAQTGRGTNATAGGRGSARPRTSGGATPAEAAAGAGPSGRKITPRELFAD